MLRRPSPLLIVGLTGLALSQIGCLSDPDEGRTHEGMGTYWKLADDSELAVITDPWPPPSGRIIKLIADVGLGDSGVAGVDRLQWRVVAAGAQGGSWQDMVRVRDDPTRGMVFEKLIILPRGRLAIHFRVYHLGQEPQTDLTDWTLDVQ